MNTTAAPLLSPSAAAPRRTPARARRVLNLLERLPHGQLDLEQPDGRLLHLPRPPSGAADAHCVLHDWQALERTLKSGDIGLAEGYIAGEWDSPDLAALLRLCMVNRDHVQSLVYGSWWGRLGYRLRHLLQRNTRAGSARNIHAHYDLGNDFYRLWLDPGMSYSAAWFQGRTGQALRNADLQEAQQAKLRRTLDEVRLQPGQRLLEIGCGWGGLAEAAAQEFGARVTGVTLSREQLVWGQQRMQQAGLADAVELRYQDYRDLPARHAGEPFDAIVSIEMFEAVGREYWRGYFQTLRDCLKPGGPGLHTDHHAARGPVRALSALHRLHPAVHLPGRPAAQHPRLRAGGAARRPGGGAPHGLRPRLCGNAQALAPVLRGAPGDRACPGL